MTAETIHASTVAIGQDGAWRAVLIAGPSGSGKSDLALRLIDRGARLVSDDYTDLVQVAGRLVAAPPPRIAGLIEVRGVGIVPMPHLAQAPVGLLIALDGVAKRMPELPLATRTFAGIAVPVLALAAFEAATPIKIEMALAGMGTAR